jgi:hypothetical protein
MSDYRQTRLKFSVISVGPRANAELLTKFRAALDPPPYAALPMLTSTFSRNKVLPELNQISTLMQPFQR